MSLTRIKEDVTALSYELFKRKNFSIRFRVKTYSDTATGQSYYYHNEYVFTKNNKRNCVMSINPKSYIQIDIVNDIGNKVIIMVSEMYKNKIVRKISKLVALLEAYDSNEIDIVTVDSSGTHINKNFPSKVSATMGRNKLDVEVIMKEESNDVMISLLFDDSVSTVLSIHDFIDIFYKLKDINYTYMSLQLLNYLGSPSIGSHEVDFRENKFLEEDAVPDGESYNRMMKDLDKIKDPEKVTNTKKINW